MLCKAGDACGHTTVVQVSCLLPLPLCQNPVGLLSVTLKARGQSLLSLPPVTLKALGLLLGRFESKSCRFAIHRHHNPKFCLGFWILNDLVAIFYVWCPRGGLDFGYWISDLDFRPSCSNSSCVFFDTVLDCSVFAILQRFWTLKKWNLCRRRPRSADDYVPLYHQEVTSQSLPKPTGRDEARAGACFSMERSTRAILVLSKARYLQSGSCETTSIVNLCKSN